jgi:hypothetical protein
LANAAGHVAVVTDDVDATLGPGACGRAAQYLGIGRGVAAQDQDVRAGPAADGAAERLAALGGGPSRHAAGIDHQQVGLLAGTDGSQAEPAEQLGDGLGFVLVDLAADGVNGETVHGMIQSIQ